jgi:hypothetical protein
MFKKNGNKLTDVAVLCGIFAGVLIVVHLVLGLPLIQSSKKLKKKFDQMQSRLRESETLIRTVPNPAKEIEIIEKKAEEFKDMEMNKNSASEHSITLLSLKPRDDLKIANENLPAGVSKVYIEMVLNASYQKLAEYISDLLKLPITFIVENISIQKSSSKPAQQPEKPDEKGKEKASDLVANVILSTYMVWEF